MFILQFSANAQITIKGTISDSSGRLSFSNVMVKEKSGIIIQFTSTNEDGAYSILLKTQKDSLFIEASSFIHEPKTIALKNLKAFNNELILNLNLEKKATILNEVTVNKVLPIIQKKDTTEYNSNSFKDGSEKVIEDLLKKLPGIKVESTGEIKYKGKTIKKMLLDGDDLFDSNYTIGTKNINVDMVEKIQGIDNYEENNLLKGITDSEDVALNLVLKKGITDISGNATFGYGIKEKEYGNISGILVNKKVKAFGISSYNNVGQNNTPYDFNSEIISLENLKNNNLISKSILNEGNFGSILDNSFQNQNKNFYSSINTLNKVFKKSSFKINAGFYQDELNRMNISNSKIVLEDEIITIDEFNLIKKKPKLFDLNLYFNPLGVII